MAANKVGINYEKASVAAEALKKEAKKIMSSKEDLDKQKKIIEANWLKGEDVKAFDEGYDKFSKEMEDMYNIIYSIQNWLCSVSDAYYEEEKKAKSAYSKIFGM